MATTQLNASAVASSAPLSPALSELYQRDGFIVVPDLLTAAEADAFVAYAARPNVLAANSGLLVHRRDPVWMAIAAHRKTLAVVAALMNHQPRIVQTMYLNKPAGGAGHSMHQDAHYIGVEPNTLMACWLALSDTDGDNGGLCVVPGSHRAGLLTGHKNLDTREHDSWEIEHEMSDRTGRTWMQKFFSFSIDNLQHDQIVRLTVPKGAAVFFTGLTIHGSFANRTPDRPRRAFATHYVAHGSWVFRKDIQNTVEPVTPAESIVELAR